ncbi:TadE family type IV pilus minor pilin [Streptomyces sp. NPDC050560]|uniref:TadE family type IV pilus minor pilin n=1 Tax=Streptomyces sp. NPDC050560 TaxID=3365630 RepID=UPI0037AA8406
MGRSERPRRDRAPTAVTAAPRPAPRGRPRPVRPRGDGGFATVETATVLPALVVFVLGLVWALLAAAAQIQCVDAARAGARSAARQDPDASAVEAARRAAPRGARVTVRREGELVLVTVVAGTPGPGALALRLRGEAAALAEETVATRPRAAPQTASEVGEA